MMENNLPLEEQSINQIFLDLSNVKTYTVPIYQRNYAWGKDEIDQLITDVCDSCKKNVNGVYYIGTLVTYDRGEGVYEVIDGQQRLTTIYIILKALGAALRDAKKDANDLEVYSRLTYTARRASASTIERLGCTSLGGEVDNGIKNGYDIAKKALDRIVGNDSLEAFKNFFRNNVHIIHYRVPKDVDLNHYFEVMNSRGEQLEKHEIVKSLLYQYLGEGDRATFSRVWEACSEMGTYIQDAFPDKDLSQKKGLFDRINDEPGAEDFTFWDIPKAENSEGKKSIKDLMKPGTESVPTDSELKQSDKFQPIIDFPNFLLVVLKVTMLRMGKDVAKDVAKVALDDKELLNVFESILKQFGGQDFVKQFAANLLKAKYLLDNYVVHHTIDDVEAQGCNPWLLRKMVCDGKKWSVTNLSSENNTQDELVQLLSMFEVTYTAKQRKNYLVYCLLYLFGNREPNGYLKFLQSLADKYFYDVYLDEDRLAGCQPTPKAFDVSVIPDGTLCVQINKSTIDYASKFTDIYKQGNAGVPLFVFNYTDYILWKKYASEVRGKGKDSNERKDFFEKLGCSDFGLEPFDKFYFTRTRRSLEHFFPQANVVERQSPSRDEINCFGNFAMIGSAANSSGSNWSPKTKLDHYMDKKTDPVSVASLKFRIMMQVCRDNYGRPPRTDGQEWIWEDIKSHQCMMLALITDTCHCNMCDECRACNG